MNDDSSRKEQVDERFQWLHRRYGHSLNDEQLEQARKGVEGIVEAAEAMKSVTLQNADEPFFVFAPYREEE